MKTIFIDADKGEVIARFNELLDYKLDEIFVFSNIKWRVELINYIHRTETRTFYLTQKNITVQLTPETKLKELIPEGCEIDCSSDTQIPPTQFNFSKSTLVIPIRKKEKTFEDYMTEYCKSDLGFMYRETPPIDKWLPLHKIGLLKYICKDFNISWISFLNNHYKGIINGADNILPKSFLDSIINDK